MRNFLIYSPPYSRRWGGTISLHKLCDLINRVGGTAFMHPQIDLIEMNAWNLVEAVDYANRQFYEYMNFDVAAYVNNSGFNTPVRHILADGPYGESWIVVYPEVILGNPVRASNVVRWLLHNPANHTGRIGYGPNELHIRSSVMYDEFHFPSCTLSENILEVMDYDFGLFNTEGVAEVRSGTAYCRKKGSWKTLQHDLTDSILIDDLNQEEIARTFKSVRTFYSYDAHTAYSSLAALCGCDSVVIPDDGVSEAEWLAGGESFGVAYGVENIEKARQTIHLVKPQLQRVLDKTVDSVVAFMNEADSFFSAGR